MENLLTIMIFLPLIAGLILMVFLRGDDAAAQNNAKWLALIATLATFLTSIFLYAGFDPANTGFQFVEDRGWHLFEAELIANNTLVNSSVIVQDVDTAIGRSGKCHQVGDLVFIANVAVLVDRFAAAFADHLRHALAVGVVGI